MAKPEDHDEGSGAAPDDPRPEEGALRTFFEAARAAPAEPPATLAAAIMADAESLRPRPARPVRRRLGWGWPGAVARLLGGWAGAATLAGCLALGLWVGAVGPAADLAAAALWTESAAADASLDALDGFFDLAMGEG